MRRNPCTTMPKFFTDEKGRWLGSVSESSGRKTYLDNKGRLVSRVFDNRTYDAKGAYRGPGDQGQRLLGEKPRR